MKQNIRLYLEYFNKVPGLISDRCNNAIKNSDKIVENINECLSFRDNLKKDIDSFYRNFKDKVPKELFAKMEKYLNYYEKLVQYMLYIMYEANFNKYKEFLNNLNGISERANKIENFAGKKIDDIIKEFEDAQTKNQNNNSQTMQPYTQADYNYGYQSSRSNSNSNTHSTPPSTDPTLNQKLYDVRKNYGNTNNNFGQSVMQTTLEHELIDINKRLEELQNKQDLSFKEKAELTKLQMDKEDYEKYISDYTNSIRSSFRESRLGKTEKKINNVKNKITDNNKNHARSYIGRRIQKHNLEKLNNRLAKLNTKKGILMDKQEKAVRKRVERNSAFINVTNNIGAYGHTLGTEVRNIYGDLKEYFSSCKENNKLLNRLEQLKSKLIVCERTYPVYSNQQARTL